MTIRFMNIDACRSDLEDPGHAEPVAVVDLNGVLGLHDDAFPDELLAGGRAAAEQLRREVEDQTSVCIDFFRRHPTRAAHRPAPRERRGGSAQYPRERLRSMPRGLETGCLVAVVRRAGGDSAWRMRSGLLGRRQSLLPREGEEWEECRGGIGRGMRAVLKLRC